MRKLLSLLMGMDDSASSAEMRKQYQRLVAALLSCEYEGSEANLKRYQGAREKLSKAYENYRNQSENNEPESSEQEPGEGHLLGEILVDSQLISREQLTDALKTQAKAKLPLGRILVACKLISWEQLAYYLRLQDLLQLPASHPERLARQLLELGLASKSEMEVAALDCETTGCSMVHAIERRGWIKARTLAALVGTQEKAKKEELSARSASSAATATSFAIPA